MKSAPDTISCCGPAVVEYSELFFVASFGRSGYYLVWFFVEQLTVRQNVGCYKSQKDIPIHCKVSTH